MSALGNVLSVSLTAELREWTPGTVLKLYRSELSRAQAEQEAAAARLAHAAGLPTPAVGDVVVVQGRAGIVFERVSGPTMLQALVEQPQRAIEFARQLADLHAALHEVAAPALPRQRDRLHRLLDAPGLLPEAAQVRARLDTLPDGASFCHGDLHPGNILFGTDGPVVIDFFNAVSGSPLADVARTVLLLKGATPPGLPPAVTQSIERLREPFVKAYLERYSECRPLDRGLLERWRLSVLAARLCEPLPPADRKALQEQLAILLAAGA